MAPKALPLALFLALLSTAASLEIKGMKTTYEVVQDGSGDTVEGAIPQAMAAS
eukprot:COSAG05_NODE_20984_length_275_cov_0.676136_1_plen_53_part_00